MSESDPLSLADLERYDPQPQARGDSLHYLCPFCGDDYKRDNAHRKLRVWPRGAWYCVRCGRRGLLDEHKTPRDAADPLRPRRHRPPPRCAPPPPREPSPAKMDEDARKRETLCRLWAAALPLDAPEAAQGAAYLAGRGIPLRAAQAARVRFAEDWYGRPSVVFPVQDGAGRLVAAEGRYTDGRADPKGRSAGPKSRGVFEAMPGALAADGVTLCEGPITALSVAACGFPALALCGHVVRPWVVRRLALRDVFVSLDWHEAGAEENGAAACRALAALGARAFRLAPPAGNDWNDYLQARGLDAMRAELDAAICGTLTRRSAP